MKPHLKWQPDKGKWSCSTRFRANGRVGGTYIVTRLGFGSSPAEAYKECMRSVNRAVFAT